MAPVETLSELISKYIPYGSQAILSKIEFYTREDGFKLTGDCISLKGEFVGHMSYDSEYSWELGDLIRQWHKEDRAAGEFWNKAELIVFRDGYHEKKTWWDQAYQENLYSDGIWE